MKKYFILMLAAVGMLGVSCGDDNKPTPTPPPSEPDITINATEAEYTYYNNVLKDGSSAFYLSLGDMKLNPGEDEDVEPGNLLQLALYGKAVEKGVLPAGSYRVANGKSAGFCNASESGYVEIISESKASDPLVVESGTIEVIASGDKYTIQATLELENSQKLTCNYTGTVRVMEGTYSPLEKDYEPVITDMPCQLYFYGKAYTNYDAHVWVFFIMNQEDGSDGMQLALIGPANGIDAGVMAGTYPINTETPYVDGELECIPGSFIQETLDGTWYMNFANGYVYQQAPALNGQVEVAVEGNKYTLTFELYDDATPQNKISGSWSGVPEEIRDFSE